MEKMREQQIIDALVERLAAIKPPDFNTAMGANIFQGRGKIPKDLSPYIAVATDEDQSVAQRPDNVVQDRLKLRLEGCTEVTDQRNPDVDARRAYQDILRAIWGPEKEARYLAGLVSDLNYGGRVYFPREDGAALVYVQVFIQCAYQLNLANP